MWRGPRHLFVGFDRDRTRSSLYCQVPQHPLDHLFSLAGKHHPVFARFIRRVEDSRCDGHPQSNPRITRDDYVSPLPGILSAPGHVQSMAKTDILAARPTSESRANDCRSAGAIKTSQHILAPGLMSEFCIFLNVISSCLVGRCLYRWRRLHKNLISFVVPIYIARAKNTLMLSLLWDRPPVLNSLLNPSSSLPLRDYRSAGPRRVSPEPLDTKEWSARPTSER